jgi:hypothetical protein
MSTGKPVEKTPDDEKEVHPLFLGDDRAPSRELCRALIERVFEHPFPEVAELQAPPALVALVGIATLDELTRAIRELGQGGAHGWGFFSGIREVSRAHDRNRG